MATNTSGIKTSGGDYSTIAAWESATDTDLVTAGDIELGELYGTTWAENTTIAGATTDASNYRILQAASGERHDGTSGGGGVVIDPSSDGHAFTVNEAHFHAHWLRITGVTGGSNEAFRFAADGIHVSHCVIHDLTASSSDGIHIESATTDTAYVWNCIFYDINRSAILVQGSDNKTVYVYNCSAMNVGSNSFAPVFGIDQGSGKHSTNGVFHCKNCIADEASSGTECYAGNDTAGVCNVTNCATADSDITTGENVTNNGGEIESIVVADEFVSVTGGSEDLHLKAGADALLAGVDLSADSDLAFDDDIDGNTRSGTWDIGAHQFSGGGGTTHQGALAATGSATFAAAPSVTFAGELAVTGSATFTADGNVVHPGELAATGSATFTADGTVTGGTAHAGALAVTGSATFTADGNVVHPGALAVTGSATFAAAGQVSGTLQGELAVTGSATFAAAPNVIRGGALSLSGSASFAADGKVAGAQQGELAVTGSATFAASPSVTFAAELAATGSATFAAAGNVVHPGELAATGSATFAADGTRVAQGALSASGSAVVALSGNVIHSAAVALAGSATFSATLTRFGAIPGRLSITGRATFRERRIVSGNLEVGPAAVSGNLEVGPAAITGILEVAT